MNTKQLIMKIAECVVVITHEHMERGPEGAEIMLRRLQLLWLQERPVMLQNEN